MDDLSPTVNEFFNFSWAWQGFCRLGGPTRNRGVFGIQYEGRKRPETNGRRFYRTTIREPGQPAAK